MEITTVVVTYGDRWRHLKKVIDSLETVPQIKCLVIVNNACSYNLNDRVSEYNFNIKVINLELNTGSANGFYTGIKYAVEILSAEYIYTLDDDTRVFSDTVEQLLKAACILHNPVDLALVSLRPERKEYLNASNGIEHKVTHNSFYGFHMVDKVVKVLVPKKPKEYTPLAKLAYAPYGGLLLSKSIIDKIGYPNPDLFLYSDDTSYTSQINNVCNIYLVGKSKLEDVDVSWDQSQKTYRSPLFDETAPNFRVFYSLRNRVYFESRTTTNNKGIYFLNMFFYFLLHLMINAAKTKALFRESRFRIIASAIYLGLTGNLKKKVV
ncbi:MAG: glycosyltransferase [Fibrobacterales bacterium]